MINNVVKRNIEQSIRRENMWSAGPFLDTCILTACYLSQGIINRSTAYIVD